MLHTTLLEYFELENCSGSWIHGFRWLAEVTLLRSAKKVGETVAVCIMLFVELQFDSQIYLPWTGSNLLKKEKLRHFWDCSDLFCLGMNGTGQAHDRRNGKNHLY